MNEGNDVTAYEEFLQAESNSKIYNLLLLNPPPPPDQIRNPLKWKNIILLNNLQCEADYIVAYKLCKVGTRHKIMNDKKKVYNDFPSVRFHV